MGFQLSDLRATDLADERVRDSAEVIKEILEKIQNGTAEFYDWGLLAMEYGSLPLYLGEDHPLSEVLNAEADTVDDKLDHHVKDRTAIYKALVNIRDYPGIEAEEEIATRKQDFSRLAANYCLHNDILCSYEKLRFAKLALKYDSQDKPSNLTILAMAQACSDLNEPKKALEWLFCADPENEILAYMLARERIISLLVATNQSSVILPIMLKTMQFYPEIANRWVNLERGKGEPDITLDQKIENEPENANNYLVKGVYECVTGSPEQGLATIKKGYDMAAKSEKIPGYFLLHYAECLAKYGPEYQAQEFIDTRLKRNHGSKFASEKLAETLRTLWLREADKAFEQDDIKVGLRKAFAAAELRRMSVEIPVMKRHAYFEPSIAA